jgi:hypothetical protein
MSSRTRTSKRAAGVRTINIPRQRGRGSDQFIVVVPQRQTMTRRAAGHVGAAVWEHRQALAPAALALTALALATLLHFLAWWAGFAFVVAALAAPVCLTVVQRRRPALGSALGWRLGLSAASSFTSGWMAAATLFGPLAGPLGVLWLLALIGAQTAWLIVRRTH